MRSVQRGACRAFLVQRHEFLGRDNLRMTMRKRCASTEAFVSKNRECRVPPRSHKLLHSSAPGSQYGLHFIQRQLCKSSSRIRTFDHHIVLTRSRLCGKETRPNNSGITGLRNDRRVSVGNNSQFPSGSIRGRIRVPDGKPFTRGVRFVPFREGIIRSKKWRLGMHRRGAR